MDPTNLPPNVEVAPVGLMSVTFCARCSANPCSSQRCSYQKANLKCNELCKCKGTCCNGSTIPFGDIVEFNNESYDEIEDNEDVENDFDD